MRDPVALLKQVQMAKPLVHHITNYVTVNDCANITLAVGASPIMADALEEVGEIAAVSSAVVLNIGTLCSRTIASMLAAGKAANEHNVPVVFDPVGAGASKLRRETALQMIREVQMHVVCGNRSEIFFLAGVETQSRGVDAADAPEDIDVVIRTAKALAARLGSVVAVTGAADIITDGSTAICIRNGHPILGRITGTGCMCTSLVGSFCGAVPTDPLTATAAAVLSMGVSGEIAWEMTGSLGLGSFRTALHNAVSSLDVETLRRRAHYAEV